MEESPTVPPVYFYIPLRSTLQLPYPANLWLFSFPRVLSFPEYSVNGIIYNVVIPFIMAQWKYTPVAMCVFLLTAESSHKMTGSCFVYLFPMRAIFILILLFSCQKNEIALKSNRQSDYKVSLFCCKKNVLKSVHRKGLERAFRIQI